MGDVAGINDGFWRKRLDVVDGLSAHPWDRGGLVKADVAVGELEKCEF